MAVSVELVESDRCTGQRTKTYVERAVEGSNQAQNAERQADPATPDTTSRLVGNLIKRVSMGLPSIAEANVRGANGAPDEEVGETRERQEPREDGALVRSQADEGQQTESDLEQHAPNGAALVVDVSHELGSHATLSHCLDSTGRAESARVGDGNDSQSNNGVEDGGENLDTGVLDGKHEWRCLGVRARSTLKSGVVGTDDETDNEEVDNVEEEDSPEGLLSRLGDGLPGIVGLGSGKTDELSTTKGKSGGHKD